MLYICTVETKFNYKMVLENNKRNLYVVWSDNSGGIHSDYYGEDDVEKYMTFKGVLNHKTLDKYFHDEANAPYYERSSVFDNGFNKIISWQWEDAFTTEMEYDFYKTY